MKSYRKKGISVLVAVVVMIGLLFGCPSPTTDKDPCPGNSGCYCKGVNCPFDPPCTCYDPGGGDECLGNCNDCDGNGSCGHIPCNCPTNGNDFHSHNFTTTHWNLLGFDAPGPTNVVSAMNDRWNNAKNDVTHTQVFYPILESVYEPMTVNGITFKYINIYGDDPMIRFVMDGSNMRIFGSNTDFTIKSIKFDVVVINDEGQGWFTEGIIKDIPGGTTPLEVTPSISISDLANGKITNVSGLASGGYKVYVIIRNVASLVAVVPDFNNHSWFKTVNVIRIYPDSEDP